MIRINLLPHREAKRIQRKKDFVLFSVMSAVLGGAVVFFGGTYLNNRIDAQTTRNNFIKAETVKLEDQIKEIANLRQELASLKARQTAVENLQTDRTLPVHLLDELVKHVPEGVHLKQIKQEDLKVVLIGVAQSNERVSELLRATAYNTAWIEKPELVEIKSTTMPTAAGREPRRVYEFQMNALLKRPVVPEDKAAATPTQASAQGLVPATAPVGSPAASPSTVPNPAPATTPSNTQAPGMVASANKPAGAP